MADALAWMQTAKFVAVWRKQSGIPFLLRGSGHSFISNGNYWPMFSVGLVLIQQILSWEPEKDRVTFLVSGTYRVSEKFCVTIWVKTSQKAVSFPDLSDRVQGGVFALDL